MKESWIGDRWEIDEECTCLSVRVAGLIEPGARWRVATVGSAGRSKKDAQDMATARLIAAAPEMYEALQAIEWVKEVAGEPRFCPICRHYVHSGHSNECKLGTALKKARGES